MYLVVDQDRNLRWRWALHADDHRKLTAAPRRYDRRVECLCDAADAAGGSLEIPVVERVRVASYQQRLTA